MKEAFPSNGEREVASALLLLSAISSSPLPKSDCITDNSHKVALSNSNSKSKSKVSSILTTVDCSFMENRPQSRHMKMIATFCDQSMKLKVVRQELLHFDCWKMSSGKPASATTSQTTFCRSSVVSSSSSSWKFTMTYYGSKSLSNCLSKIFSFFPSSFAADNKWTPLKQR